MSDPSNRWHSEEQAGNLYVYTGTPGTFRVIAALADVHPADDRARSIAARIVACVNACHGIPTEELESVGRFEADHARLSWLSWHAGRKSRALEQEGTVTT